MPSSFCLMSSSLCASTPSLYSRANTKMEKLHIAKKIDRIKFGFFSPQDVKKMSVCKVVTPELYDKEGYPVDGGLMDTRMGVIDPGLVCRTDGRKLKDCPGYFGHIELARPVIHIKYIGLIIDLLRATCRETSKLLLSQEKIDKLVAASEGMTDEERIKFFRSKGLIKFLKG